MTIESATFISGLNALNPGSSDAKSEGDDHLRLLKSTIKATFPNITGAVTLTHTNLNAALFPDGSGFVGLGTGSATAPLHVVNAAGVQGLFEGSGQGAVQVKKTGTLGFSLYSPGATFSVYDNAASAARLTVNADGSITIPGALNASIAWTSVTGRPTNVSAFTNDAGYLTSAGTVTWTAVTGKPTAVSYFTNDSGYQTTAGTVTNLAGGSVAATTISASGNITTLGTFTATGLVYGRAGGSGLGRISTTTTTGSPGGTSQGDLVLVY